MTLFRRLLGMPPDYSYFEGDEKLHKQFPQFASLKEFVHFYQRYQRLKNDVSREGQAPQDTYEACCYLLQNKDSLSIKDLKITQAKTDFKCDRNYRGSSTSEGPEHGPRASYGSVQKHNVSTDQTIMEITFHGQLVFSYIDQVFHGPKNLSASHGDRYIARTERDIQHIKGWKEQLADAYLEKAKIDAKAIGARANNTFTPSGG